MEFTPDRKPELISLRMNQAKETIEDVAFLIHNDRLVLAINRIYYGMFYALLALAIQYEFKTSKHAQLIGWFNKEFIKTGKIGIRFSKIIQSAFNARTNSDYGIFIEFSKEETIELFVEMKFFIEEVERFLNADLNYDTYKK
jgi:uncharacterized protein (UPF0332 family)